MARGVPRDRISKCTECSQNYQEWVSIVSEFNFFISRCYNTDIGLPFYGRSFKYASALKQEHGGNDLANWGGKIGYYWERLWLATANFVSCESPPSGRPRRLVSCPLSCHVRGRWNSAILQYSQKGERREAIWLLLSRLDLEYDINTSPSLHMPMQAPVHESGSW